MYYYHITFWIADEGYRNTESLNRYEDDILKAIEYFNDLAKRARNPKHIKKYVIEDSQIQFWIGSSAPLLKATLAMQNFSKYLVKNSPLGEFVKNSTLFRGTAEEIQYESNDMTDTEMIKQIIDIVLTKKEKDEKILDEIKSILLGRSN